MRPPLGGALLYRPEINYYYYNSIFSDFDLQSVFESFTSKLLCMHTFWYVTKVNHTSPWLHCKTSCGWFQWKLQQKYAPRFCLLCKEKNACLVCMISWVTVKLDSSADILLQDDFAVQFLSHHKLNEFVFAGFIQREIKALCSSPFCHTTARSLCFCKLSQVPYLTRKCEKSAFQAYQENVFSIQVSKGKVQSLIKKRWNLCIFCINSSSRRYGRAAQGHA